MKQGSERRTRRRLKSTRPASSAQTSSPSMTAAWRQHCRDRRLQGLKRSVGGNPSVIRARSFHAACGAWEPLAATPCTIRIPRQFARRRRIDEEAGFIYTATATDLRLAHHARVGNELVGQGPSSSAWARLGGRHVAALPLRPKRPPLLRDPRPCSDATHQGGPACSTSITSTTRPQPILWLLEELGTP
jgi:hypothetical protein